MNNRRDFLKTAATGAVLLGAQSKMGFAGMLDKQAATGKSKVVVARDAQLHGADGQLDEKRVLALLDRAIASYTGHEKPVESWKRIVPVGKVIGLKINGLGGKGIATHRALVMAICERLQQAGVKPSEIIVWDRFARDIENCGMTINTDPSRIRVFGTDVSGYEEQSETWGTAKVNFSKILTRECAMVIGLPILKDHEGAGVTFAMKNMYGVVHPERLWQPNALIVGEDRVAVDHIAWQMIEKKRAEAGMKSLTAVNRPPSYIATAADAAHKLGTNDPQRIHLLEV
jgi:hypothetical protein